LGMALDSLVFLGIITFPMIFHIYQGDEPRYYRKNVATPKATDFTYQPEFRTNLEVIVLYTQVGVRVLPVVTAHLERDPRGSKPNFYRVRRSLILMEGKQI